MTDMNTSLARLVHLVHRPITESEVNERLIEVLSEAHTSIDIEMQIYANNMYDMFAKIETDNMLSNFEKYARYALSVFNSEDAKDNYSYMQERNRISSIMTNLDRVKLLKREIRSHFYKNNLPNIHIPGPVSAPVRVEIRNARVQIVATKNHIGSISDSSIERIRRGAKDILERILNDIDRYGNIDPRVNPACIGLLDEISQNLENMSIEAVGLNWQIVSDILDVTQETIPDAVLVQLRRVLTIIHTVLSQYDEWQIYLAAEIKTKLTPSQIQALALETKKLAGELSAAPEVIEPKIIDRLTAMTDAISLGIVQAEGLGIALVGSVSNLLATFSQVALEYLPDGITNLASNQISASPAAISGMVLLTDVAIRVIKMFAPTYAQFAPLSWLIGVHTEVMKYASYLKDMLKRS